MIGMNSKTNTAAKESSMDNTKIAAAVKAALDSMTGQAPQSIIDQVAEAVDHFARSNERPSYATMGAINLRGPASEWLMQTWIDAEQAAMRAGR